MAAIEKVKVVVLGDSGKVAFIKSYFSQYLLNSQ